MKMGNKYTARKFNLESYKENDEWGKDILKSFLIRRGHTIKNDKENYKHDIETTTDIFEVEVKIGYPFNDRKSFKFDTVSFLGRKKRLHDIEPFHYVIICKETKCAITCQSTEIFKERYKHEIKVNSKDRKGKDLVYRVPIEKCKFFNL